MNERYNLNKNLAEMLKGGVIMDSKKNSLLKVNGRMGYSLYPLLIWDIKIK